MSLQEAQKFLKLLDPESTRFTFQVFKDYDKKPGENSGKIFHGSIEDLYYKLKTLNDNKHGIFVTVNETDFQGREEQNIVRVRSLWVDLDGAPIEPVKEWSVKPHIIVQSSEDSGIKKYHAYYLIKGLRLVEFRNLQKRLIKKFDGDGNIHDLPRVMRLPGFYHKKNPDNPSLTKIIEVNEVPIYTREDFKSLPAIKEKASSLKQLPDLFEEQHETTKKMVIAMRNLGCKNKEILVAVSTLVKSRGHRVPEEGEIESLVNWADKHIVKSARNLTGLGNSERLYDKYGNDIKYDHSIGKWFVWDGQRWLPDDRNIMMVKAIKVVREIKKEAFHTDDDDYKEAILSHANRSESYDKLNEILNITRSFPSIASIRSDFDKLKDRLNCNNGIIDLRTGELYPHDRKEMHTKLAFSDYDKTLLHKDIKETAPKFHNFLMSIMKGKESLIKYIQRALGYGITGLTTEQVFFIFYGVGKNGKSTLLDTVSTILGDYFCTAEKETITSNGRGNQKQGGSASPDIVRLDGPRMVLVSETEQNEILSEAKIKVLSGSDTITARALYQKDSIEFKPQFKLFLQTNHKPRIIGTDLAIWRRVALIPFTHIIPPEKRVLDFSNILLQEEKTAIFAWLVTGAVEWFSDGLLECEEVTAYTEAYRENQDRIGEFLTFTVTLTEDPEDQIKASDLYQKYRVYEQTNGQKPLTNANFKNALMERGYKGKKASDANYWTHIKYRGEHNDKERNETKEQGSAEF